VANNRASGTGIAEEFSRRGFEIVAYDRSAHGESKRRMHLRLFQKQDLERLRLAFFCC
jgi:alpha-beta hydrolase superfamily lysophospholipase